MAALHFLSNYNKLAGKLIYTPPIFDNKQFLANMIDHKAAQVSVMINALYQKRVCPHESRFSVHRYILQMDHEFLDALVYVATCALGDHACIGDFNDSTHHTCITNYGFTYVNIV